MHFRLQKLSLVIVTLVLAACQSAQKVSDPAQLVQSLQQTLPQPADAGTPAPANYLSEQDAVLSALAQNPGFKAQLSDLNLANADIDQASQLANPSLFYAFGAANKPYRYAIEFPIEALWLRPIRTRQMQYQAQATQYQLLQAGFNLIRDTRVAYAQAVIAMEKQARLQQALQLNQAIADLVKKREQLGDISTQEVLLAENEALLSGRDAQLASLDSRLAQTQLMHLIGQAETSKHLALSDALIPACSTVDIAQLKTQALSSRPDILAAEAAVAATRQKRQLTGLNWLNAAVIADATSGETSGHTLAPAIRGSLPLFNQNQAQISRADAELVKAQQTLAAAKVQASLELHSAHLKYQRDCLEWRQLHEQLQPNLAQTQRAAEQAYQHGEIAYLNVLESSKRFIALQLRETQLKADLVGSWSELMRSSSHSPQQQTR
ncbi:TolC family protein [Methylophilus luteus]|uniref:TolC family protein n=1 Tax=Methylophilus luteus TaxID=640108 RepID=A0ABW3F737_9PROT